MKLMITGAFFLRFSWNILTELISPLSALMAHMIGCLRKENDVQAVAGLRLIPSFFFWKFFNSH
jgi:hypothetical protein